MKIQVETNSIKSACIGGAWVCNASTESTYVISTIKCSEIIFEIILNLRSAKLVVIWHELILIRLLFIFIYILRFISMLRPVCKLIFIYKLLLFINGPELILIFIMSSEYFLICICQLLTICKILLLGWL